MSDSIYIGNRASNIDVSPQFQPYSKVIIHIDDDTQVVAGNNTGRTLEIDNPFGNQQMANAILQSLSGFQYQPYNADEVLLDPAAEIGDAIETPTIHGGIYSRNRSFGRLMKADVAAPNDEEINHEYVFETPTERAYKRQVEDVKASFILTNNLIQAEVSRATEEEGTLRSTLSVQATEIAAKVSQSGGGGSFSWVLNSNSHTWKSNNTDVMRISASGLWIKGTVEAATGKIGGFDIGSTALSYNGLTWGDTSKNYGVYIGQSGIQLGKNFSVSNSGAITASSMSLKGTLTFLNSDGTLAGTMSAADLRQGAKRANDGYSDWNSAYASTNVGGYCYGGAGGGYAFNKAATAGTGEYPAFFTCGGLWAESIYHKGGTQFDLWDHEHSFSEKNGRIYIGGPVIGNGNHFFDIAATQTYQNGVAAVAVSYINVSSSPTIIYPDRVRVEIYLTNGNSDTFYASP